MERYRKDGFNNISVTLQTERIPGRAEVEVLVNLEEGPQQRIREVLTTGRARTLLSVKVSKSIVHLSGKDECNDGILSRTTISSRLALIFVHALQ